MATPALDRPLADADLERLQGLLESPEFVETAMPIDVMQGFFAAVASSPRMVAIDEVTAIALGGGPGRSTAASEDAAAGDAPELDPPAAAMLPAAASPELVALVRRFYNEVSIGLYSGDGFDFVVPGDADEPRDYEGWCMGYLDGAELWADDVDALLEDDELSAPFLPIAVLGGDLDDRLDELAAEVELTVEQLLDDYVAGLLDDVFDIYEYFLERRKGVTVRREAPRPGRNDPCPCGSGKKFKLCHGRDG